MPLSLLVSLLRGWGVSIWSWFWIGHIYILIIYTNTTNNIYNILIEIKGIWCYIHSVLSIMTLELFLVPKKNRQINQFFAQKTIDFSFFLTFKKNYCSKMRFFCELQFWEYWKKIFLQICIKYQSNLLLNKIVMTIRTSMAHICATGTLRVKILS